MAASVFEWLSQRELTPHSAFTLACDAGSYEDYSLFAVESGLSSRIRELAIQRGVSPETLLNLWAQERLQEEAA